MGYMQPTGPDQEVEHDWLYERADGTTVPVPGDQVGRECGQVTPAWEAFLVPVPEEQEQPRRKKDAYSEDAYCKELPKGAAWEGSPTASATTTSSEPWDTGG